jgi:hypothetical protein
MKGYIVHGDLLRESRMVNERLLLFPMTSRHKGKDRAANNRTDRLPLPGETHRILASISSAV